MSITLRKLTQGEMIDLVPKGWALKYTPCKCPIKIKQEQDARNVARLADYEAKK